MIEYELANFTIKRDNWYSRMGEEKKKERS